MGFIYKIYNDFDDNIYIGKTQTSIQQRWSEHLRDMNRRKNENRHLYNAMNKYGSEHFFITQIEEINNTLLSEREKYWIKYYDSYNNGYNCTRGGDGSYYADYNYIYELWNQGLTGKKIKEKTNYDLHTIKIALESFGVTQEDRRLRSITQNNKVAMIDKNTDEILMIFNSQDEAGRHINPEQYHNISINIGRVCKGTRKTAAGYKWKYI